MWTKFKLENNANSILDLFFEQTVKITIIKINNNPFYVYNLINDLTISQFTDSNAQPTKYRNSIFLKPYQWFSFIKSTVSIVIN